MLRIKFDNFHDPRATDLVNIDITEAKSYYCNTSPINKAKLFAVLSGLDVNYTGLISLNELDIKTNSDAKQYLQKHTLFLENNAYIEELNLITNMKLISKMWSNENLVEFAIKMFKLENYINIKIKQLPSEIKSIVLITHIILCPSHFWVIDNNLINQLSDEVQTIINDTMTIRTKHGGAALILV